MSEILAPPLSGVAQARFVSVGRRIREMSEWDDAVLQRVLERETAWAETPAGRRELRGEVTAYRASVRALLDLVRVGWRVEVDRGTIELLPPPRLRSRLAPDQVRACKDEVRRNLWPLVAAQLDHPEFRRFVRRLESPSVKMKTKPVTNLITSGEELSKRLKRTRLLPADQREMALAQAVQPYLQLVSEEVRDEFTGLPLGDIWRYFRATWSIPNIPVPGRSMLYLVRDAAHPSHAVMGLIALNNAPMRKRALDEWAGWTPGQLRKEAETRRQSGGGAAKLLTEFLDACIGTLREAASNICLDALLKPAELVQPKPQTPRRLLALGDQFEAQREKVLKDLERQNRLNVARRERKAPDDLATQGLPPLADGLPDLEKATPDAASRLARRLLVAKKRAYELSRLLQAQLTLNEQRERLTDPSCAGDAWSREEVVTALGTVCAAMKSARLSSNLLEVTTCGAIPPYNHLLGGKLAALLCFSPQIGADYQARYGGEPAIIRSHMANRPMPADCRLAAVVTTSLYAVGSSQYERVRLPAGIIAPDQPELRVRRIGESSGFGTVHFSPETVADIEDFARAKRDFTEVNSVFGEGPSPKLRKLRAGLDLLGFSADDLLKHHQVRLVYALEFWPGAAEFLRFGRLAVPEWVAEPQRFTDVTARIAAFWRQRWLAPRLDHDETWSKLQDDRASWRLSDRLPVARKTVKQPPAAAETAPLPQPPPSGRCIYERLAERRSDLYSERLTNEALDQLHVETSLDRFVLDAAAAGQSLVLTGNAGDGKTHLLRRLRPQLPERLEVIEDATAEMIEGRPEPVLERIRRALNASKPRPFVLCANEHQLLLLREAAARTNGRLAETFRAIDEQCRRRLVHGPVNPEAEAARGVTVLDLSLRNPLAPGFAKKLLDKLLNDPEVRARAAADPRVDRNHRRLSNPQVRERLLTLFDRVVLRGERATVRQLWMILARAVFAPDNGCAGDAPGSWYSEQIFDCAGRLEVDQLLARFADPAAHSHPRWDWHLREGADFNAADWPVDGPPIGINRTQEARHWFDAVKRRFYFEHRNGNEIFAFDSRAMHDFHALLRDGDAPDINHLPILLRGLNRLFCPAGFFFDDMGLYQWRELGLHEHPSCAFIAADFIPKAEFRLSRPRPSAAVAAAFGSGDEALYVADHLLLSASSCDAHLRIDYPLFVTLSKLAKGNTRNGASSSQIRVLENFVTRVGSCWGVRPSWTYTLSDVQRGLLAHYERDTGRRREERAFAV